MILQDVPNHLKHSLGGFQHTVVQRWKARCKPHICDFVDKEQNAELRVGSGGGGRGHFGEKSLSTAVVGS